MRVKLVSETSTAVAKEKAQAAPAKDVKPAAPKVSPAAPPAGGGS